MKTFRHFLSLFLMLVSVTNLFAAGYDAPKKAKSTDMTYYITNPSFETGDETGWELIGKDQNGNDEFRTRGDYDMSNKDGGYLMNAYQWWTEELAVSQTITNLPSGIYVLSAVVATWEGRVVTFSGNDVAVNVDGLGDQVGIPVSLVVRIGAERQLTIRCGSTGRWWEAGREGETQTFFKLDNVRLSREQTIGEQAVKLPNDDKTILSTEKWYKYTLPYPGDYWVVGNLTGLQYTFDADLLDSEANILDAERQIKLAGHNVYLRTSSKNTTVRLASANTMATNTFTACALNVDGLPQKLDFGIFGSINLNEDGPGQDGTLKISQYLAGKNYDIIGCSEDFNYNNALMSSLWDNYSCGTIRARLIAQDLNYWNFIQGKIRVDTDGLNLIWKNGKIAATNESWTKWNTTEDTDGNQYVKKGFRHYDLRVDDAVDIDAYILHMDAGDTNATWSREAQWRQLCDAINNSDHSKPKLVIGDTNSRWTREDIISNFMNRLSSDFSMGDAWVEFGRNGVYPTTDMENMTDGSDPTDYSRYEIVDKIIYINPSTAYSVQLQPMSFLIEQDYTYGNMEGTDNETPLGDHRPTVSKIRCSYSSGIAPLAVSLTEYDSNEKTLTNALGAISDITLRSFAFLHNDVWRPLCLPFNVNDLTGTPFEGAILKELDILGEYDTHYTGIEGNTLYLFFKDATKIVAGRPYLIKWESGDNTIGPVFKNVYPVIETSKIDATDGSVSMIGSFSPVSFDANDASIVYLDTKGNPVQPTKRTSLTSCRAYFKLAENIAPEKIVLGFSGYTDGIGEIENEKMRNSENEVYDLSGRKIVNGQIVKLNKGVYIRGGKTVVIK